MPRFDPKQYNTVAERVTKAHADVERAPSGIMSIEVKGVKMLTDLIGVITCRVILASGAMAEGTAHFELGLVDKYLDLADAARDSGDNRKADTLEGLAKSAQATNAIEDAETSAIGRALAFLGYETKKGIASAEDMHRVNEQQEGINGRTGRPSPARAPQTSGNPPGVPPCPDHPNRTLKVWGKDLKCTARAETESGFCEYVVKGGAGK